MYLCSVLNIQTYIGLIYKKKKKKHENAITKQNILSHNRSKIMLFH